MLNALICLVGVLVLIAVAYAFSVERRAINWRTVGMALGLQAFFCALVLYVPAGQLALAALAEAVGAVLNYARDGILFVFKEKIHKKFPVYNWKKNKGYPTKEHRKAIQEHGITKYHRKTFKLLPSQLKLEI